jgi:large repetitive protein
VTKVSVIIVIALVAALAAWATVGFGAPTLAAPTITSSPPLLSSSRTASFTYTDSQPITSFECSLDGGSFGRCGTTRPSSTTFKGLADGRHVFQVRAVSGSTRSSATSFSWTVDATAPKVVSILRAQGSPTNAASVQWTVTFTEAVTGVASLGTNFSLVASGLTGSPSIASVSGSGAVYTVTASTGASTTGATGSLQLRLTNAGTITDGAGNLLTGLPVAGDTYTIDKIPPLAPSITSGPPVPPSGSPSTQARFRFSGEAHATFLCSLDAATAICTSPATYTNLSQGSHLFAVQARDAAGNVSPAATWTFVVDTLPPDQPALTATPSDPTTSRSATFAWTDHDPAPGSGVAADTCRVDAGAPTPCSSPSTYAGLAFGTHTFSVVVVDHAGNTSSPAAFTWTIVETGLPFSIAGDASSLLYPGAPFTPIALTITNPNSVPIFVTSIIVTVGGGAGSCAAADLEVQQSPAAPGNELQVPASATAWPVPLAFLPRVRLKESGASQDGCTNQSFSLSYTGSAHS